MKKTMLIGIVVAVLIVAGIVLTSAGFVKGGLSSNKAAESKSNQVQPSSCNYEAPTCGSNTCNNECGGNCGIPSCGCSK